MDNRSPKYFKIIFWSAALLLAGCNLSPSHQVLSSPSPSLRQPLVIEKDTFVMGTHSGIVDLTGLVLVGNEVVLTTQGLSKEDECANISKDELAKVAEEKLAAMELKSWDVMLSDDIDSTSEEERDEHRERISALPRLYLQFSAREIPNSTALVCWIKLSLIHYLAVPRTSDPANRIGSGYQSESSVNGTTWASERVIVVEKIDSRDTILKATKQMFDGFAEEQATAMRAYLSR